MKQLKAVKPNATFDRIIREMTLAVNHTVVPLKGDWFCGFAHVNIDGTSSFAKYMKAKGLADRGYPRGCDISVYPFLTGTGHEHTQSMTIKEEACRAMVRVLASYAIVGSMQSRPD